MFGLVGVYGYGEKDCDLVGGMLEEIEGWVRKEGLDGFMVFGDLNARLGEVTTNANTGAWLRWCSKLSLVRIEPFFESGVERTCNGIVRGGSVIDHVVSQGMQEYSKVKMLVKFEGSISKRHAFLFSGS